MRFREDRPQDLERARTEVAAWRIRNPQGTPYQLITDLGGRFHPDYGPVLRSVLFALERRQARITTGVPVAGEGR